MEIIGASRLLGVTSLAIRSLAGAFGAPPVRPQPRSTSALSQRTLGSFVRLDPIHLRSQPRATRLVQRPDPLEEPGALRRPGFGIERTRTRI
jgi:hypothetical protein